MNIQNFILSSENEESEDEHFHRIRSKRPEKRKIIDSDASGSGSDDDSGKNTQPPHKLIRANSLSDCSNGSSCATSSSSSNSRRKMRYVNKFEDLKEDEFTFIDIVYVCGERVGTKILYALNEKELYTKNGSCNIGVAWRCRDRNCPARIIVLRDGRCIKLNWSPEHRHIGHIHNSEISYQNLAAVDEMRTKCRDILTIAGGKKLLSVRAIFTDVKKR